MEAVATRNSRKVLTGTVTSRSGDKTIKVTYFYKIPHPLYKKEIRRKTVVHAHDEQNECGLGDRVEIMETRPLSKLKRWRVTRVLEVAPKLGDE
ncbi:MAG: 30S ribosomal protein S17 [Opitutales bacterium]